MKKTAVITGGVRRLGGEISRFLLENNFQVCSINSVEYSSADYPILNHPDFKSIRLDLLTAKQSDFQNEINQFKTIDLLINNASIFSETDFFDVNDKTWDDFFSINLKSIFFLSQSIALKMKNENKEGNIINIIDSGGDLLWTKYFIYNLTKNNLIHLTKLMAKELAPLIRVNGIAPGTIIPFDNADKEWVETAKSRSALKKIGDSGEIIRLIDVILKSNFMTGSILTVDGGRSLL